MAPIDYFHPMPLQPTRPRDPLPIVPGSAALEHRPSLNVLQGPFTSTSSHTPSDSPPVSTSIMSILAD